MEWNSVRSAVRRRGAARFVAEVVTRFRDADGTSHTRALAYRSVIVLISSFIGLVGLAIVVGAETLREIVAGLRRDLAPGPNRLLLWSVCSSAALPLGLAVAAELAGTARPDALVRVPDSPETLISSHRER